AQSLEPPAGSPKRAALPEIRRQRMDAHEGRPFALHSAEAGAPVKAISHSESMHRPLANSDIEVDRLVAAEHLELRAAADAIAEQTSEQLIRRGHRLAVERQQQIADEHASLRGRSAARHADDQQRVIDTIRSPLRLGQLYLLPREPEVATLQTAVLENGCRG